VDLLGGSRNDPPVEVEPPPLPKVERRAGSVGDGAAGLEDQQGARGVVPDLLAVALERREREGEEERGREEGERRVSFCLVFFSFGPRQTRKLKK
jgi:hypothetical protein